MGVTNRIVLNATKWSSAAEIAAKLISPITNAILARLLVPAAFGAVATINLIITFAELFTDAGFQKYIIQHEFKSDNEFKQSVNVAFWTNLVFSVILWALIIIFRNPLAALAGNATLGNGVAVAGFTMILVAFSSIQTACYKRNLDFKTLFYIRVITSGLPLIITVPLAIVLRNYWALIFGSLATKLIEAIILFIRSKWLPKFTYSFKLLKEMISFSSWTILESVSIWLTNYIGVFIVGNLLSDDHLGVYQLSITTVNAYMAIITSAIMPVVFSTLSRFQNDNNKYLETLYNFQKWVALLVIPMSIGLFMYRDLVTDILLGSNWEEAALLVGMWSLTSGFTIVYSHFCSEVYRSKGKPKISLLAQLLHLAFLIPTIYFSAQHSFELLAITRSLIRFQGIIVHAILLRAVFKISFVKMIKNTFPCIVVSCLMAVVSYFLQLLNQSIVWSVISIGICILFYVCVMLFIPSVRNDLILITASYKKINNILKSINNKINLLFR